MVSEESKSAILAEYKYYYNFYYNKQLENLLKKHKYDQQSAGGIIDEVILLVIMLVGCIFVLPIWGIVSIVKIIKSGKTVDYFNIVMDAAEKHPVPYVMYTSLYITVTGIIASNIDFFSPKRKQKYIQVIEQHKTRYSLNDIVFAMSIIQLGFTEMLANKDSGASFNNAYVKIVTGSGVFEIKSMVEKSAKKLCETGVEFPGALSNKEIEDMAVKIKKICISVRGQESSRTNKNLNEAVINILDVFNLVKANKHFGNLFKREVINEPTPYREQQQRINDMKIAKAKEETEMMAKLKEEQKATLPVKKAKTNTGENKEDRKVRMEQNKKQREEERKAKMEQKKKEREEAKKTKMEQTKQEKNKKKYPMESEQWRNDLKKTMLEKGW